MIILRARKGCLPFDKRHLFRVQQIYILASIGDELIGQGRIPLDSVDLYFEVDLLPLAAREVDLVIVAPYILNELMEEPTFQFLFVLVFVLAGLGPGFVRQPGLERMAA